MSELIKRYNLSVRGDPAFVRRYFPAMNSVIYLGVIVFDANNIGCSVQRELPRADAKIIGQVVNECHRASCPVSMGRYIEPSSTGLIIMILDRSRNKNEARREYRSVIVEVEDI